MQPSDASRKGEPLHVTLTRVKTNAEDPIENASIVGEEMERWLRDVEGFEGMMLLSRPGETIGLTFWESREVAERMLPVRNEFLARTMSAAEAEVEERLDFTVTFARVRPGTLADTG